MTIHAWVAQAADNNIRFVIPGSKRIVTITCDTTAGLRMLGPIPGGSISPGRAVALIIATETNEGEILTGVAEQIDGELEFVVSLTGKQSLLSRLAQDEPMRIARLTQAYVVPDQGLGASIINLSRACRPTAPRTAAVSKGSYWRHDNSIVRLEATGTERKFIFYKPSTGMSKLSAKPGDVRFQGRVVGSTYSGTATLFTEKCGRRPYQVQGPIENESRKVTLVGRAPRLDGNCRETGLRDMTLTFDFMDDPPE
ncbi:hypothetical protein [Rhodoplanes sp. Z2-YC6860]|uniref:hypothetical protein n=1 Tax=Rhodoplanes sp. Z2-YC6860 TaxID=674703 RepID=UPI0012EDA81C|nr:hypothetical protein [Rhodoplanes sp. Z2-YC6860]